MGVLSKGGAAVEPRWLLWLAAVCLGGYALLCVGPWSQEAWRAEWDSALYLETARSLSRGEGYRYLGEAFYLRPPGLPWMLSFLFEEGAGLPIAAANRMLMACAAGTIIALFFLLRARFGTLLALAVALLTGTSPLFVKQFNYVLSEFPYLLLCFLGMAFCASWSRRPTVNDKLSFLQVPLFIGAFYLRSQAILLLPGVLLLEWKRRGLKRALLPTLLIAAACLPWMVHASSLASQAPTPSRQFKLHDYSTALFRVDPSDPRSDRVSMSGWVERIGANGRGLLRNALGSVHLASQASQLEVDPESDSPIPEPATSAWGWLIGSLLTLALLAGFGLLLRTGWGLFEWFVVANTTLILIYFTYAPRLAMPLVPAFYLYLLALPLALTRTRWRWAGQLTANLLTVILLAANLTHLNKHRQEPAHTQILRRDINAMAAWAREHTPEDAVILCKQGPMLGLKSDRKTYSSRYEAGPEVLQKYAIDYVIFFGGQGTGMEQEALLRGGQSWEIEGSKRIVAYELPPQE